MPRPVSAATLCPGPVALLTEVVGALVDGFRAQIGNVLPSGPLLFAIWRRVQRLANQLRWLATTDPAPLSPTVPPQGEGKLTDLTPRRIRARKDAQAGALGEDPGDNPGDDHDPLTTWRITREHGWLIGLLPNLHPVAAAYEEFLHGLGTEKLLAADPRFAALLRRLGWMLGVNLDLLVPASWEPPPPGPLDPAALRPAPPGYPRTMRVNQCAYDLLEARRLGHEPPPDPAKNSV